MGAFYLGGPIIKDLQSKSIEVFRNLRRSFYCASNVDVISISLSISSDNDEVSFESSGKSIERKILSPLVSFIVNCHSPSLM